MYSLESLTNKQTIWIGLTSINPCAADLLTSVKHSSSCRFTVLHSIVSLPLKVIVSLSFRIPVIISFKSLPAHYLTY